MTKAYNNYDDLLMIEAKAGTSFRGACPSAFLTFRLGAYQNMLYTSYLKNIKRSFIVETIACNIILLFR